MTNSLGHVIDQAYTILSRTYKELIRLKDDCASLLLDGDPPFTLDEEYSYGGKFLHLRANHTFLFRFGDEDDSAAKEGDGVRHEEIFALICIFQNESGLNRVSLKNEPELWAVRLTVQGEKEKVRPWDVSGLLKVEERSGFVEGSLVCDGKQYKYDYKERDGEGNLECQWYGTFVGYPLVDISDRQAIEQKLLEPWREDHKSDKLV